MTVHELVHYLKAKRGITAEVVASLLERANSRFMDIFASWLEKQPAANLAQRSLDASRLYATAFELTIIGAYADSLSG